MRERMTMLIGWTAMALMALECAHLAHAQQAGAPQLMARGFEPAADAEYTLGRGDEISIRFNGRPEMDSKQTVGPDGKVTLPLAGSVLVADKTREDAAAAIATAMSNYYSAVSVTVGVEKYTSNQVLLLGAVEHPGVQQFDRRPTLLEVVSRGGVTGGGGGRAGNGGRYLLSSEAQPVMGGVPERVAVYRGSDKVLWVELRKMLDSGSAMADMRLQRDDIVYVPSGSERFVSVLGQVQHPGAFQLDATSSLAKVIALAGGLTPEAGQQPNIQVVQANGHTRVVPFKELLKPGGPDLTLGSGDVIYVPKSGFNKFAYAVEKMSPLVTMFTASALFVSH